jgi:hypothetical protein
MVEPFCGAGRPKLRPHGPAQGEKRSNMVKFIMVDDMAPHSIFLFAAYTKHLENRFFLERCVVSRFSASWGKISVIDIFGVTSKKTNNYNSL